MRRFKVGMMCACSVNVLGTVAGEFKLRQAMQAETPHHLQFVQ